MLETFELLFSDIGCYHFTGAYTKLTYRVRARTGLAYAEAWVGIGCLRRPMRVRFYATLN